MPVQQLPVNIDLVVFTGTTFRRQFRWKPGGVGQDFTGWTAEFKIGPARGDLMRTLSETGGVQLDNDGTVTVLMEAEETETLQAGTWKYMLDLANPAGEVLRLLRGRMSIVRDMEA
jgi:hypothetical protein